MRDIEGYFWNEGADENYFGPKGSDMRMGRTA
jgi:hypothetical protein